MNPFISVHSFLRGGALVAACVMCAASNGVAVEQLAADSVRPDERAFLEKAIASSREQQRLAELGSSNATSSEVRSHAQQLKSDYRQLADTLDALIRRKAAITHAASVESSETYLQLAARTGAEFDGAFVKAMAALHRDTIALFEQAAAESKDADVRELAASQLPTLRAHLNRITQLSNAYE